MKKTKKPLTEQGKREKKRMRHTSKRKELFKLLFPWLAK